jgi:hypothetical protein
MPCVYAMRVCHACMPCVYAVRDCIHVYMYTCMDVYMYGCIHVWMYSAIFRPCAWALTRALAKALCRAQEPSPGQALADRLSRASPAQPHFASSALRAQAAASPAANEAQSQPRRAREDAQEKIKIEAIAAAANRAITLPPQPHKNK